MHLEFRLHSLRLQLVIVLVIVAFLLLPTLELLLLVRLLLLRGAPGAAGARAESQHRCEIRGMTGSC